MLVFIEGLIGERLVAEGATGFEERAVHVVDALGAGALVEIVYILGAEIEILRVGFGEALLDLGEGFVRGVGLGGAGVASALGVERVALSITHTAAQAFAQVIFEGQERQL